MIVTKSQSIIFIVAPIFLFIVMVIVIADVIIVTVVAKSAHEFLESRFVVTPIIIVIAIFFP